MNIFVDCEYNGMGGQLLSIALVSEAALFPDFYAELEIVEELDPWVAENVVPLLRGEPVAATIRNLGASEDPFTVTLKDVKVALEDYLSHFDSVHLIADWPEDISYFCKLLVTGPGTRIDTPPLTLEIRRDIDSEASMLPHHALHDAQALRCSYRVQQGKLKNS